MLAYLKKTLRFEGPPSSTAIVPPPFISRSHRWLVQHISMCWTSLSHSVVGSGSGGGTGGGCCCCRPSPNCATCEEADAIVAVAKGFLAALNSKSRIEFEKYSVAAGGMSLSPPSPGPFRFCTIGAFIEQISSIKDEINERIWDPEVKVHELGNLAAVWAPFRANVNGVLDHVGVELFILHKVDGEWKVTGLADSCRWPTAEERAVLA